jgi:hypothetical protein
MAVISGQKAVETAGTALPLVAAEARANGPVFVKALAANTGLVFVGNDGADDVTSANGFQLAAGEVIIFAFVGDLRDIVVDSAVNGEGVCWLVGLIP